MVALHYFRAMIKKVLIIILFCCINSMVKAEKVYEFNSTCQQAYLEISKLKFANAKALIEKAKQQNSKTMGIKLLEFCCFAFSINALAFANFSLEISRYAC